MIKQAKFTVQGMSQDISKAKHPNNLSFENKNIRIINTDSQSSLAVSNEKGNEFLLQVPNPELDFNNNQVIYDNKTLPYNNKLGNEITNGNLPTVSLDQVIIGKSVTRQGVILFTTDNNGFDCIWEIPNLLSASIDIILLYCRNLGFSNQNPIQAVFNYENEIIQKVYWVDGINQLRFLNIKHNKENGDLEELIDLNSNSINTVGEYSLSQAKLQDISGGGSHTSGVIQYSYNLYKLNGSQTTIAPLSEQVSLDNGITGGGIINEIVGVTPSLIIPTLDTNYSHIKIYAIKYTSYNQSPIISLIEDRIIDSHTNYIFSDDGNNINDITLAEFIFLGSNPLIPKHIESKDNRLFSANIKDTAYVLDIDMRAYSHNNSGICKLYTGNVYYENNQLKGPNQTFSSNTPINNYNYLNTSDAINPNYDDYTYQKNGTTIGGEGLFIKYEIVQKSFNNVKYLKFLKDDEIYRYGIQFYNVLGQYTDVKWIADHKAPSGNLEGNYNTLKVTINQTAFNNYITGLSLSTNKIPVGYKIVRAERDIKDRTILCQGSLTGMMVQTDQNVRDSQYWNIEENRKNQSLLEVKIPIPISRGFVNLVNETSIYPTGNLTQMTYGRSEGSDEIYRDNQDSYKNQHSWQYTKMSQMHSPDILFNTGLTFGNGLELKVKGISLHTSTNNWFQEIVNSSNRISRSFQNLNIQNLNIPKKPFSIFGPITRGGNDDLTNQILYNRQYKNFVSITTNTFNRPIYGSPEITERGQGTTSYAGNTNFRYNNSLESVISDSQKDPSNPSIKTINSYGGKCLTIVEGLSSTQEKDRKTLEGIISGTNLENLNGLILSEVVKPISYIYEGGIYGGNSVEDKARTTYTEIGIYTDINTPVIEIDSPGDTFVQLFNFGRILKTDTEILNKETIQLSETVEFNVETTVNLQNRNDLSLFSWDNKFQPRYDEYHKYNRVYSQTSNLVTRQSDLTSLKPVNNFDTRVIASKLKTPGELIDSWTDFLENETIDLDGKYGAINALVNSKDQIYALQDKSVSKLAINPRVQTQGNDGIGIELGKGAVLYDYNYLTTASGTINKWSVFPSPEGFYYLDALNKNFSKVQNGVYNLSDDNGFNAYFKNNINFDLIKKDNPLIKKGVTGVYDVVTQQALITVLQDNVNFTMSFNEKLKSFESFYDFTPSLYINNGTKLLTVDPSNRNLYSHQEGNYNQFYETYYPSYIILQVNPESDLDCTFNNIEFKSEAYINGVDQPNVTINFLQAYNEYQNTGKVPLIVGRNKNLNRKFRKWSAIIARNQGTRDRIRNSWIFLKLELNKNDNTQFILHDVIVNYTV